MDKSITQVENLRKTVSDWAIARAVAALSDAEVDMISDEVVAGFGSTKEETRSLVEALRTFAATVDDPHSLDGESILSGLFGAGVEHGADDHHLEAVIAATVVTAVNLRAVGFEASVDRAFTIKRFDMALAHVHNTDDEGDPVSAYNVDTESLRHVLDQMSAFEVQDDFEEAVFTVIMHMAAPIHATDEAALEAATAWFADAFPEEDESAFLDTITEATAQDYGTRLEDM